MYVRVCVVHVYGIMLEDIPNQNYHYTGKTFTL